MAKRFVYMDHNATTPLHPQVEKTMTEAMKDFGNPSSLHSFGRKSQKLIEDARAQVAALIGAEAEEIIFAGSGSEANNTVLSIFTCPSIHCSYAPNDGRQILTTSIEHPCVLETSKCLHDRGEGCGGYQ